MRRRQNAGGPNALTEKVEVSPGPSHFAVKILQPQSVFMVNQSKFDRAEGKRPELEEAFSPCPFHLNFY
jgi:hypothetical protein